MKFSRVIGLTLCAALAAGGALVAAESDAAAKAAAHRPAAKKTTKASTKATAKRTVAARSSRAKATRSGGKRKGRRVCHGTGRHRSCRYVAFFSGHGVSSASLRIAPLPHPSGNIWLYAVNFREEVKLDIYAPDGSFDEAALADLDHRFRCKRTGEERAVDPRLYEVLSIIQDHFDGKRIELISGFRFQRNEGSRHFHASAMDIRIEGVSINELHDFAETLDPGGMGIGLYPESNFVHVDFRAPGEPSYRWVDRNPDDSDPGKRPSKQWHAHAKKPTS